MMGMPIKVKAPSRSTAQVTKMNQIPLAAVSNEGEKEL